MKIPFSDYTSFTTYEEYKSMIKKIKDEKRAKDKNHTIRVSNHAVERYIERTGDRGLVRGDIREIIREK